MSRPSVHDSDSDGEGEEYHHEERARHGASKQLNGHLVELPMKERNEDVMLRRPIPSLAPLSLLILESRPSSHCFVSMISICACSLGRCTYFVYV